MTRTNKRVRVGFLGFFKLNLLYGLALGQLAGLGFLAMSICGQPVHFNLGSWHIDGLLAGVAALISLPPAFGIALLVVAPLVYLPFTLACRICGGFEVS